MTATVHFLARRGVLMNDPLEAVRAILRAGDEYCEVTSLDSPSPEFLLCRSAADTALAQLRALYLDDGITIEQFEQGLDEIMVPA